MCREVVSVLHHMEGGMVVFCGEEHPGFAFLDLSWVLFGACPGGT